MEVIIGKTSGFCHGVKNAVEKAIKEVTTSENQVYCLGELVHNKHVTNNLHEKGLIFIENIEEIAKQKNCTKKANFSKAKIENNINKSVVAVNKPKVIIRAHGVEKKIYEKAKKLQIELVDLTCPKVIKIHDLAEQYAQNGYYIFLVGIAKHPETIGTFSFCGKNACIIEHIEDLENSVNKFKKTKMKKALLITQTTFNLKKFEEIANKLKEILKDVEELKIINTICSSTELRQKETEEISQQVDLMLIIGGKNSSNTNKLYEISQKNCKNVIFAESQEDINLNYIKQFDKIGIMAGASTPRESIDDIVQLIKEEEICNA